MKKIGLYEISVILFFVLLPVAAALIELLAFPAGTSAIPVLLKWLVFSGVGLRLFTSGVKQAVQPGFTAKEIFEIADEKCYPIVRELGFANICMGMLGIVSLCVPAFRYAAGITGGLYFLLAGLLHVFRNKTAKKEIFALVSDFYISAALIALMILSAA